MTRILKTRVFARWMKKTELEDKLLCKAIEEMEKGLIDADLGGHLYKKRIPLPGKGKRGSTRTIIATKRECNYFFILGFSKNDKENITDGELSYLQMLAHDLLEYNDSDLETAIDHNELLEVHCNGT